MKKKQATEQKIVASYLDMDLYERLNNFAEMHIDSENVLNDVKDCLDYWKAAHDNSDFNDFDKRQAALLELVTSAMRIGIVKGIKAAIDNSESDDTKLISSLLRICREYGRDV